MNRGLLIKSMRETATVTVILATALLVIEAILAFVLPTFVEDFSDMLLQVPFFQMIFRALLGTDVGDALVPEALMSIGWVHPVALAIVWTHAIVFCTRVPAGEVDRGTIDVLFGLPVSRWRVYLNETVVFLATGVIVLVMGLLGHRLGLLALESGSRPDMGRLLVVCTNLYGLYLAVGGLAFLVSALNERRGRAVAIVFAILLASFLLNFLAQFWAPAQVVSFLGLLNYYQPFAVLNPSESGQWPVKNIAVLVIFAVVAWGAGGVWFARRDLCTV